MVKKSIVLMSISALSLVMASTAEAGKFNQGNLVETDNLTKSPQTILTRPQPEKPNKTKTEARKSEEEKRIIKAFLIGRKLFK